MKYGADPQEPQLQSGMSPNDPAFGIDPDGGVIINGATGEITPATPQRGCQQKYYESIRDAIRTGAAPAINAQDAVNVMTVLDAFYLSAREGRTVPLPHGSNQQE